MVDSIEQDAPNNITHNHSPQAQSNSLPSLSTSTVDSPAHPIEPEPIEDINSSYFIQTGHSQENKAIPVGEILPFESENFKGRVFVRVKEDKRYASYFANRSRLSSVIVTGRFKNKTALEDLLTGQEFKEPLKSSPGWFLVNAVLKAFKFIAPLLQAVIASQSHFLSPVAQTAQRIHIAETSFDFGDGTAEVPENSGHLMHSDALNQDVFTQNNNARKADVIKESSDAAKPDVITQPNDSVNGDVIMRTSEPPKLDVIKQHASGFYGKQGTELNKVSNKLKETTLEQTNNIKNAKGYDVTPITNHKLRRKFFSKPRNLKALHFDTDKVYTFEFYDDKFDLDTYTVNILGQAFDVSKYLDGQPMRIMARHKTPTDLGYDHDNYLWNFEIWHRKLDDATKEKRTCTRKDSN